MPYAPAKTDDDMVRFARHPGGAGVPPCSRRLADNGLPPYKFAYARTALKYGLRHLGIRAGDAVLVPAFICESALEPLGELGIEPLYYPVTAGLGPDWPALAAMVTRHTRALLVVHYFGQPQPLEDCRRFCQSHSLLLIEDNAHGFGGTEGGQPLGTFGDIGVAAPRKTFPIANGAYLYVKQERPLDVSDLRPHPPQTPTLKHWIRLCVGSMPLANGILEYRRRAAERRRRLGPPLAYGSQAAFRDPPIRVDYSMDERTHAWLARQDLDTVRRKRRQIYALWQRWAEPRGLTPVFPSLSPGAVPLVFAAYVQSRNDSLAWFERGHRFGVDIHSWPTLPQAVVKQDGEAMRLWERLVCFPIHQEMDLEMLRRRQEVL